MEILSQLLTSKTDILLLDNSNLTLKQKKQTLGLKSPISKYYLNYIYLSNNKIYYFKEEGKIKEFPFSIIEELMGTYLCKILGLETIKYRIAKANNIYGLASLNFRTSENEYYFFHDIIDNICNDEYKIEVLKEMCINQKNYEELIKSIINMLVLDIYMIQKDRCNLNIQFKINKQTHYFSLSPLYDFSNCLIKMNSILEINNEILNIKYIKELIKLEYFKERLNYILEISMVDIWKQICIEYNLDINSFIYERIKDYYEIKTNNQKKYIKQLINDIQL